MNGVEVEYSFTNEYHNLSVTENINVIFNCHCKCKGSWCIEIDGLVGEEGSNKQQPGKMILQEVEIQRTGDAQLYSHLG